MTSLEKGDLDMAERTLEIAAQAPGATREVFYDLGEVKLARSQADEAVKAYERAAQVDPTWGKPPFALGRIALDKGDAATARKYFQTVMDVDPVSPEAAEATTMLRQLEQIQISRGTAVMARRPFRRTLILRASRSAPRSRRPAAGDTRGRRRPSAARSSSSRSTRSGPITCRPTATRRCKTPAIDLLAANGVVFERAYSHAPQTLPAHTALLSGRLPFETGVRDDVG